MKRIIIHHPVAVQEELIARLSEAESFMGSPMTRLALDAVDPNHRRRWLRAVRSLLTKCGTKPENLPGRWHTS